MRLKFISLAAVVSVIVGPYANAAGPSGIELSTPPGVTLIDVTNPSHQFLWRHLADSTGKPLYTFDADGAFDKATCVGECAKEFSPYLAKGAARASGDWSLIDRGSKQLQWAYKRQPLYYFNGVDPGSSGPRQRGGGRSEGTSSLLDPSSPLYSPKQGWRRAAFTPEESTLVPSGMQLKSLPVANGYGFVNQSTGMPLYIFKTAPKNLKAWTPMYAQDLAVALGDFTIIQREDSTRQWAYKGQALYAYKGDYSPSDLNGSVEQSDAQPALALRHFMPRTTRIDVLPTRGPLMVSARGMSLYTEAAYALQYGGRQSRDGYRVSYADAKAVGTRGCEAECLKTWKPLLAVAGDEASGFWEIQERPDGGKQWAYKGSPLYSYVGDKKPGDVEGNNQHVILYGDPEGKIDLTLTGGNRSANVRGSAGSGFYWHLVGLYN